MEHDPFGGSSLWRRKECVGSYWEEEGLPELETDEARMGTRSHAVAAILIDQFKRDVGVGLSQEHYDALEGLQDEEVEHGVGAFGFFAERFQELHAEGASKQGILCEQRCDLLSNPADPMSPLLTWGTADALVVVPEKKKVVVFDWKFGYKEFTQDAISWQVMQYAQGAMEGLQVEDSHCYIYNPRLNELYQCAFGIKDGARKYVEVVVKRGRDEKARGDLKAGDHCTHCKALGTCAATVKVAKELVAGVGAKPKKTDTETKRAIKEHLKTMPTDRLLPLLDMMEIIKPAVEALKSHAKARLTKDPQSLPGWYLSESGGIRTAKFGDTFHATRDLVDEKEFYSCCSVSVAKLERVVMEKPHWKTKTQGKEEFQKAMINHISQKKRVSLRRKKTK